MMTSNTRYQELLYHLEQLKLETMKEYLPNIIEAVNNKEMTFIEALSDLTDKELRFRAERAARINLKISNFPYEKRITDFDFDYQPSINRNQIDDLMSLRFVENKENILFIGSSGVGKTHLATSIGIEASSKRISTYFINCHVLITKLVKAYHENRHEAVLKQYFKAQVLIIDEIGYLPIDKLGANLFFQLIAMRYEKKPTIITTNIPLSKWADTFSDATLASAILDRLVHHSTIIKITGKSYRLKGKIELNDRASKGSENTNTS
jgi:DNA replication protein DnaC